MSFETNQETFLAEVEKELGRYAEPTDWDVPNLGNLAMGLATRFWIWMEENLDKGICCWGLIRLDEPDEREKIAEAIEESLGKLIPPPYNPAWMVVGPVAKKFLILPALGRAAREGAEYCSQVACDVAPFPNPR